MIATKNRMTISEYLLSFARKEMPKSTYKYEPNDETIQVLRESDAGENLIEPETLDDFWEELGFNKNA